MKKTTAKNKAMALLVAFTFVAGMAGTAGTSFAKPLKDDATQVVVKADTKKAEEVNVQLAKNTKHERDERRSKDFDGKKITLEQAIKIATDDVKGEVIEVEFERGRYEVKIRTEDGAKKKVYINAKDGKIVKRK